MSVVRKLLLITLPSLLVCFLFAELVFRFVIPAAELPNAEFERGLMRFDLEGSRGGLFTVGPFAEGRGRWRVNNDGWNSAIDYSRNPRRPLIAVIGDSFVEAFHVDADRNFAALVRQRLQGKGEVYSFGFSGTPLSGYLELARYARREFRADVLVINVVHNDFAESVRSIEAKPSFLQFDERGGELVEVPSAGYEHSPLRRALRHSAVVRWVVINCKLSRNVTRLRRAEESEAARLLRHRPKIEPVAEAVFARLRAENPQTPIFIMMDGPRQRMFADARSQAQLRWLPEMVGRLSRAHGFEFIDLESPLKSYSQRSGQPVAFESDYHWNAAGHAVAANALMDAMRRRRLAP